MGQQPIPELDSDKHTILEFLYGWARKLQAHKDLFSWDGESRCRILWVGGTVGTEKTTLLQIAIQQLPRNNPEGATNVTYFFCNTPGGPLGNASPALKSLISGVLLAQPELRDRLLSGAGETKRRDFDGPRDFTVAHV
ncbi:hypothetical protein MAPG_05965 [Magnaporthiopsis poae ATCC 64411]|uniref:Nephrocystin 3-like N-terminal domain-containing protein n=1 Tax=Magnaporthiopsis poae (strain ATCC 64411 / 73-15) TaxID=644358 RepID=A0A0C4E0T1_MAGP6|nr:hypothetical protein MAPG_05965 [Magnaporthiopsis poae ATCC 64411]